MSLGWEEIYWFLPMFEDLKIIKRKNAKALSKNIFSFCEASIKMQLSLEHLSISQWSLLTLAGREQCGVHFCDIRSTRADYVERFPQVDVSCIEHEEELISSVVGVLKEFRKRKNNFKGKRGGDVFGCFLSFIPPPCGSFLLSDVLMLFYLDLPYFWIFLGFATVWIYFEVVRESLYFSHFKSLVISYYCNLRFLFVKTPSAPDRVPKSHRF